MNHCIRYIMLWVVTMFVVTESGMPSANAFEPFRAETTSRLNLRIKPDTTGEILVKLSPGEPLTVLGIDQKWLHVIAVNRNIFGWVSSDYVKKIDQPVISEPFAQSEAPLPDQTTPKSPESMNQLVSRTDLPIPNQTVSEPAWDRNHQAIDSYKSRTGTDPTTASGGLENKEELTVMESDLKESPTQPDNLLQFARDDRKGFTHSEWIEKTSVVSRLLMKLSLALLSMTAFYLSCSSVRVIRSRSIGDRK